MVEFAQTYGLWIALAGVFIAMHWFGMGCCGGGNREKPGQSDKGVAGGRPGSESASGTPPKSKGSCH